MIGSLQLKGRKPIVLLDVDGVLANFSQHVIDCAGVTGFTFDDVTNWDIFSLLGERGRVVKDEMLPSASWWLSLPVLEGAQEGVAKLREIASEVVFVTSPWLSCEQWSTVRRCWLKKHFGADPEDVIITSKKHLIRGDMFIDDKASTVEEWQAANPRGHAWVYDAPYNKGQAPELERTTWANFLGKDA